MSMKPLTEMREDELAILMRGIAGAVKVRVPSGTLFTVLVFGSGEPGRAQYISNAARADMIRALRETADRLEAREDAPR